MIPVLRSLIHESEMMYSPEATARRLRRILRDRVGQAGEKEVASISDEGLSAGADWFGTNALSVLERLAGVVPSDFEVRLIVGIRRQPDMIASRYSEYVRSGGTRSLRRLIRSPYSSGRNLLSHVCYARYIEKAYDLFGRSNVYVYLLEEIKEDSSSITREIERLALDKNEDWFTPETRGRHPRLTPGALRLVRFINLFFFSRMNNNAYPLPLNGLVRRATELIRPDVAGVGQEFGPLRREALSSTKFRHVLVDRIARVAESMSELIPLATDEKYELPPEVRSEVEENCRQDNRRVSELIGRELDDFGYVT